MTLLVTPEAAGLRRWPTVDGEDIPFGPTVDSQPILSANEFKTLGGMSIYTQVVTVGQPDRIHRMSYTVGFNLLSGAALAKLERITNQGLLHTLCFWKPVTVGYTAHLGQTIFCLRQQTRNAPQVYPTLVYRGELSNTTNFPARVFITPLATGVEVELVVSYTAGALVDPGAGNAVIGRDLSAGPTGQATFRVGGPGLAAGDKVRLEYFPLSLVTITNNSTGMSTFGRQSESFTFTET